jgi:hypothetical protein
MGLSMSIGQPAPFVSAFIDAVDEAMHAQSPSHSMAAMQRAWLALCVTAVLVTNSICWARFERASLGTYSLAALSWMFRHSKIPWDNLLVASVRVILRHYGITSGSLIIDETDNQRSKSAKTLAHLSKLRAKDRGGSLWGPSLVCLVLVTPPISLPVGGDLLSARPRAERMVEAGKGLAEARYPQKTARTKTAAQSVLSQQTTPRPALARAMQGAAAGRQSSR